MFNAQPLDTLAYMSGAEGVTNTDHDALRRIQDAFGALSIDIDPDCVNERHILTPYIFASPNTADSGGAQVVQPCGDQLPAYLGTNAPTYPERLFDPHEMHELLDRAISGADRPVDALIASAFSPSDPQYQQRVREHQVVIQGDYDTSVRLHSLGALLYHYGESGVAPLAQQLIEERFDEIRHDSEQEARVADTVAMLATIVGLRRFGLLTPTLLHAYIDFACAKGFDSSVEHATRVLTQSCRYIHDFLNDADGRGDDTGAIGAIQDLVGAFVDVFGEDVANDEYSAPHHEAQPSLL